jgi:long-chain acyl-CoA synthetase
MMNLSELLDQSIARWADKPAVIEGESVLTYADLGRLVDGLVQRLQPLALAVGTRVGLQLPNSLNYIGWTYALWRWRAVVVPIPMDCPAEEIATIVSQLELAFIISAEPLAQSAPFGPAGHLVRLRPAVPADNHGLNIAFIRFTSGTTSARKGVVLCHETVYDRVASANQTLGLGPTDVILWNLPMAHHFLITIVLYLQYGCAIVLSRHNQPRLFLAELNRWKCTGLYTSPRYYGMLARDDSGLGMASVRLAVSTTSSLAENVAKDFLRRFNLPLVQALGVIELGLVAANFQNPIRHWHSVGRPAGRMQLRIVNPDADGCGELEVSGPGIFDAYAAPWVPREQVLVNGWFQTGDIVRQDAAGRFYLLSRKTSIINRAGQKIFPEEVETIINQHPQVLESRVFGRPHARLGEVVEAEVVFAGADASPEDIREHCRRQLAGHKIPAQIHAVTELPKTAVTGKILRGARQTITATRSGAAKIVMGAGFLDTCELIFSFTSG